jgi:hypothetical protein
MSELHVYHIGDYLDTGDTVIAVSPDDAWVVWEELIGEDRADYPDYTPTLVPDDKVITITYRDGCFNYGMKPGEKVALTAAQWCERDGRGFLASTEY